PDSHAGLLTIASYVVLFFATRRLCRNEADGRRLLIAAVMGVTTASIYAAVQVAHADPFAWDSVSTLNLYVRPFATLAHPNFLAGYLAMALPVILYFGDQALRNRRWGLLALLMFIGGAAGFALVTACSRGAWLAAACGLVCFALGWLLLGKARRLALA